MNEAFEPKLPAGVISALFYGSNVTVKVDGAFSEIKKIISGTELLIQVTSTEKTFKVTTNNDRVKYDISDFNLYDLETALTTSNKALAPALDRELRNEDGGINVYTLITMYKSLIEHPIKIHRGTDSTQFELVILCTPENLFSKDAYIKEQLKLLEILKNLTITLSCYFLYVPDTTEIDLQKYKFNINWVKDKVLNEINKEDCKLCVFIDD